MPPKETDSLLRSLSEDERPFDRTLQIKVTSFDDTNSMAGDKRSVSRPWMTTWCTCVATVVGLVSTGGLLYIHRHALTSGRFSSSAGSTRTPNGTVGLARLGAYQLTEAHQGESFTKYYDFYEGADSLGSAGYNTYTSRARAETLGLVNVTSDEPKLFTMQSLPTDKGSRESIRLEGKTRFDSGLFILDVDHMPTGCGQWPAFWLTDEDNWPDNGEIDILEGVNYQSHAKTALHTSAQCSQYAHAPAYKMTGQWDRATGIPDTYTGNMDFETSVPADNCWAMAPHQWANQGCVIAHDQDETLGSGFNAQNGGIFALQWDPEYHFIRSWVFPKAQGLPDNLQASLDAASSSAAVSPDPDTWGLPYAYFGIGATTGCSADHFKNMRIVINTAFCGTVAGNRFFTDCPAQAAHFNVSNDPVQSCQAWIASNPDEMNEAYWAIRGVYVYERAWMTRPVVNDTLI